MVGLVNRNLSKGIRIATINFLVVGIIGCLLRFYFIYPIPGFTYQFVLHSHSHMAFLGWVFMALYILLAYAYLPAEKLKDGRFKNLFLVLQAANIGMLTTFPFMGYAFWSILFSTVHALTSMVFAWFFIRDVSINLPLKHQASFRFVKWGLNLMVISNLAPFALGPIAAIQGKNELYHLLIYFYLHFQYNGWFTFALIGLILWQLERRGINTNSKIVNLGFYLKLVAVFPAYILSTLWTDPSLFFYFLGGLAAIAQLIGLGYLAFFILQHFNSLHQKGAALQKTLFLIGLFSVTFQHILMFLSTFPALGTLAFARPIVIAYLHLVLIGFVTSWLFFHFLKLEFIHIRPFTKIGFSLLIGAFLITELILVFLPNNSQTPWYLFVLALLQLSGIFCITVQVNKRISI